MYIWDPSNGTLKAEWEAHSAMINGCQWSPSGKYIVSCSNDLTSKVWTAKVAMSRGKKGAATVTRHHDEEDEEGEESHGSGVPVEFHLPPEGDRGHTGAVIKAAFAHDDSFVITVGKDKNVIMWNLKLKGTKDREFMGHEDPVLSKCPQSLTLTFPACVSKLTTLLNTHASPGRLLPFLFYSIPHSILSFHSNKDVSINKDSSRFVTCDNSGKLIVWDPKSETPVHILVEHTDICYVCLFCNECKEGTGRIISAGHDSRILVWNCYEGTLIGEVQSAHSSWLTSASMDNTNMKLATIGMDSKLILWQSLPPVPKNFGWAEKLLRFFGKVKRIIGK